MRGCEVSVLFREDERLPEHETAREWIDTSRDGGPESHVASDGPDVIESYGNSADSFKKQ